jgi:hypothetical protein
MAHAVCQQSDPEHEEDIDMRDVDFRLRHSKDSLMATVEGVRGLSLADITLLKLLLACGLYPNIAAADAANASRRASEYVCLVSR